MRGGSLAELAARHAHAKGIDKAMTDEAAGVLGYNDDTTNEPEKSGSDRKTAGSKTAASVEKRQSPDTDDEELREESEYEVDDEDD